MFIKVIGHSFVKENYLISSSNHIFKCITMQMYVYTFNVATNFTL